MYNHDQDYVNDIHTILTLINKSAPTGCHQSMASAQIRKLDKAGTSKKEIYIYLVNVLVTGLNTGHWPTATKL